MDQHKTPVKTGVFFKLRNAKSHYDLQTVYNCQVHLNLNEITVKPSAIPYYITSLFTLNSGIQNREVLYRLLLHLPLDRPFHLALKNGIQFSAVTFMDVWTLKETILDRVYEKAGVPLQKGWTVVDIGAASGDFAVWSALQVAPGKVVAVEPYPPSLDLLEENLRLNLVDNVSVYEGAVASQNGTALLNLVTGEAVQHSTASGSNGKGQINVDTLTLGDLFELKAIDTCDYLKLDCEGAEYDILFNCDPQTLKKIARICMEVHDGVTAFSKSDMAQFLTKNDFAVRITPNPVHANLAYLYAERQSNS